VDIGRCLREELIRLDLAYRPEPLPDSVEPTPHNIERHRWHGKEKVCAELAGLFAASGEIRNEHKFYLDLVNRERRASTAIGQGLAVPHVRSMQPRKLVLCFARSKEGVDYFSPDGAPVHLFFGVAAPSYDDAVYLRLYKWLAGAFTREEWLHGALMEAAEPGEIIRIIKSLRG
jgi:mannitol/fructose-specific phosphotransferase system IIA component (Ntr-type)